MKEFIRSNFPRFFTFASGLKGQFTIEMRVIRQVGPRVLLDRFVRRPADWANELPLQQSLRQKVHGMNLIGPGGLPDFLRACGLRFSEGGHTVYMPPKTLAQTPFATMMSFYPPDAGLKVMKNVGGVKRSEYVHGGRHSMIHRRLTHAHPHLTLVANILYLEGLGPRLYDLLELQVGDQVWTAYVIEHCEGRTPTIPECEAAMDRLRELERRKLLKVSAPAGYAHMDFVCPGCNGNAMLAERTGDFRYFDFQNFLLGDYRHHLEAMALQAASETHFGQKSLLRGGRYLYQSIPGIGLLAKRDIEVRVTVFRSLLQQGGCSVAGRLVLDVGCNIGMMLGQYLKMGAAWVHGWDLPIVAQHTGKLLLALGCTRFSLTPGEIRRGQSVETDVPAHVRHMLDGCVISYLAIRGHVGWLEALGRVPWSFMIYEGHEADTESDFETHMAALHELCAFRIVARRTYEDGDCTTRPLALLMREVRQ